MTEDQKLGRKLRSLILDFVIPCRNIRLREVIKNSFKRSENNNILADYLEYTPTLKICKRKLVIVDDKRSSEGLLQKKSMPLSFSSNNT